MDLPQAAGVEDACAHAQQAWSRLLDWGGGEGERGGGSADDRSGGGRHARGGPGSCGTGSAPYEAGGGGGGGGPPGGGEPPGAEGGPFSPDPAPSRLDAAARCKITAEVRAGGVSGGCLPPSRSFETGPHLYLPPPHTAPEVAA